MAGKVVEELLNFLSKPVDEAAKTLKSTGTGKLSTGNLFSQHQFHTVHQQVKIGKKRGLSRFSTDSQALLLLLYFKKFLNFSYSLYKSFPLFSRNRQKP